MDLTAAQAVQTAIEARSYDEALAALHRLLFGSGAIPMGDDPPGLRYLIRSLPPDHRAAARDLVLDAIAAGAVVPNSEEMDDLLDGIPRSRWPLSYLCARLEDENDHVLLRACLSEAHRRIEEDAQAKSALSKVMVQAARKLSEAAEAFAMRKKSERAHHLMRHAISYVQRDMRPPRPVHKGGPAPKLDPLCEVDLTVWLARQTQPFAQLPRDVKKLLDRLDKLRRTEVMAADKIIDAQQASRENPSPIYVAALAVEATARAGQLLTPKNHAVRWCVKRAIEGALDIYQFSTHETLPEPHTAERTAVVRELLGRMDAELLRLECALQLQKNAPEAWARIAEHAHDINVVYRGEDERGRTIVWLYRIGDGHGLLLDAGEDVTHLEGPAEELLASMPEELFEEAANVVLA